MVLSECCWLGRRITINKPTLNPIFPELVEIEFIHLAWLVQPLPYISYFAACLCLKETVNVKITDAAWTSPQNLLWLFDLEGQILKESKGHGRYEIYNEDRQRETKWGLVICSRRRRREEVWTTKTQKNSIMESIYTEQMDGYNQ